MKRAAALLALLWCVPNLAVAYWMVLGAFVAKTAMHEGILAQASLLLGGLLIAIFTVPLARLALRMFGAPDAASA